MNSNFFTSAFREVFKLKKFTVLNIIGLSIAFTFINLIALFVVREMTYDKAHEKVGNTYLLEMSAKNEDGSVDKGYNISLDQVEALKSQVPGILNVTFLNYSYFDWDNGTWLKYGNETFPIQRMAFTNEDFPSVFSFRTIAGSMEEALKDPHGLILSEDNVRKIFGDKNPIGEQVTLNNHPATLRAVVETNPASSSIRFDGLISYRAAAYFTGQMINDYSNRPFIEINPQADLQRTEEATKEVFLSDVPLEERAQYRSRLQIRFMPLKESYFSEGVAFDPMRHGNKTQVLVMLGIGMLILILAVINYVNLSFAQSFKRHKGIAVRGILGAGKTNLMMRQLAHGVLISTISLIVAFVLSELALPWFNSLINYPLDPKQLVRPEWMGFLVLMALTVGFISEFFPALSSVRKADSRLMKSDNRITKRYKVWNYLVFFQMVVSIALMAGTLIIARQMNFAFSVDMGFRTDCVVLLPVSKLGKQQDPFLQLVDNNPATQAEALSTSYLDTFNEWGGRLNDGATEKDVSYFVVRANADFLGATGIQLVKGSNFNRDVSPSEDSWIINEAAVKQYDLSDPLSATLSGKPIVGVVKDFHLQSLHYQVPPVAILNSPQNKTGMASIRFTASDRTKTANYLKFLSSSWEELAPDKPFKYEFLDQRLRNMYEKDSRLMKAFTLFSLLAILIACLGLFGIITFVAESRIKEIGIRRVNGAKVSEVLLLLNHDFVKWVAIAFVVATPIAWYVMTRWLESFAYKINLSWWIFALAGVLALGIALLTVSWQSWKAATRNPVESLRYE